MRIYYSASANRISFNQFHESNIPENETAASIVCKRHFLLVLRKTVLCAWVMELLFYFTSLTIADYIKPCNPNTTIDI